MRRLLATYALLFAALIAAWQTLAQVPMTGAGLGSPTVACSPLLNCLSATAVAAFSTRKLRTAYAGSALKVFDQTTTTQTDIGFSGGNLDTAALATAVSTHSGTLSVWYDQSNSNNGAPITASTGPQIVSSGTNLTQNGHVCPNYVPGSSFFSMEFTATQAQPLTWAMMLKMRDTTTNVGNAHFTDSDTGTRVLFGTSAGPVYQMFAGGSGLTSATNLDTNPHTAIAIYNGASSVVNLDGSQIISGNPGTNGIGGGTTCVGAGNNCQTTPTVLNVNICEAIVFSSALSAGDQSIIRSSWQTYWGTP